MRGTEGGVKTIEERLGEKGGAFFNGKEGRDDFRTPFFNGKEGRVGFRKISFFNGKEGWDDFRKNSL